jgi:NAD(P)-dependent dehydrogenase (short-subunit alcohol dehydrogenase family)
VAVIDSDVVVVTGAGSGLGAEIAREIRSRSRAPLVIVDIDHAAAGTVAAEVGGLAIEADVSTEAGVRAVVTAATEHHGRVDLWIANAGTGLPCDPFSDDVVFDLMWRLHALSIVWAARHLVPEWLNRASGHLVAVVSSNALTSNPVSMGYAMTKHAQLAAVEWVAMTYGDRGVRTTAFCPKGMRTPLLEAHAANNAYARAALSDAVTPREAATVLLDAVERGATIAHTHPAVLTDARRRIDDHEAFIDSLQQLHRMVPEVGTPR